VAGTQVFRLPARARHCGAFEKGPHCPDFAEILSTSFGQRKRINNSSSRFAAIGLLRARQLAQEFQEYGDSLSTFPKLGSGPLQPA
jgi:hypothetical protein